MTRQEALKKANICVSEHIHILLCENYRIDITASRDTSFSTNGWTTLAAFCLYKNDTAIRYVVREYKELITLEDTDEVIGVRKAIKVFEETGRLQYEPFKEYFAVKETELIKEYRYDA